MKRAAACARARVGLGSWTPPRPEPQSCAARCAPTAATGRSGPNSPEAAGHPLQSPAREVGHLLLAEVLPGLMTVVHAAHEKEVVGRRRATARDGDDVVEFELVRGATAPSVRTLVGAALVPR